MYTSQNIKLLALPVKFETRRWLGRNSHHGNSDFIIIKCLAVTVYVSSWFLILFVKSEKCWRRFQRLVVTVVALCSTFILTTISQQLAAGAQFFNVGFFLLTLELLSLWIPMSVSKQLQTFVQYHYDHVFIAIYEGTHSLLLHLQFADNITKQIKSVSKIRKIVQLAGYRCFQAIG